MQNMYIMHIYNIYTAYFQCTICKMHISVGNMNNAFCLSRKDWEPAPVAVDTAYPYRLPRASG